VLFREGKRLMGEGNVAAACEAFEGSYDKDPAVSTLLNLADCREKNQQYASAWGHFVEAARKARSLPDGAALIEVAQRRADALEARLSYLIIAVPDEARIAGLTITRNGDAVEPAEWNRTMPVDGGSYRIEAKAPAHEPWSTSVTIENEKDKESVNVPRFAEIATPVVSTPAAIGAGGADDRPSAFTGRRKAAMALGVVGVVGLGGGLGLELLSRSTYQDAKDVVDTNEARSRELTDSANRQRHYGMLSGAVGVAALGVGAYLWISGAPARASASEVVLDVGADHARFAVAGRF